MNNNIPRKLLVPAAVAALIATGISVADAEHSADPEAHPLPTINYGLSSKAIVVELHMTADDEATMEDATVIYGRARGHAGNPPLLDIKIRDDQDVLAQHFDEWDPRWVELEGTTPGQFSTDIVDEATGSIIFPFEPDLRELVVTNEDAGLPVGTFDLAPAILEFCDANPSDVDCVTDLSVTKSDSVDPAYAGETVTYTLTVANLGPNPAQDAEVVDTLPAGLSFDSGSDGCSAVGQEVTCELGAIPAGESRVVNVVADIAPDLVYVNGGPKLVTNEAEVSNLAGNDPVPSNNTSTEGTWVRAKADVSITSVTSNGPLEVLIGTPADLSASVVVANAGPSSPIDTVLTRTSTASSGVTVTPASSTRDVSALATGAPRTSADDYRLTCTTPGVQTVELSYTLSLKNADDLDPDLTNNTRSVEFSIDCVVPIAINIRPKGYPNSINLNTDATLATLTTEAGEYGLPLAFDATTIQIGTVRFGLKSLLFNVSPTGGASEMHGKKHLERSYELDERTRDADQDAVLHFKPSASGLTHTTTQACLKGRYDAGGGATYTFLGCDSVRVVN